MITKIAQIPLAVGLYQTGVLLHVTVSEVPLCPPDKLQKWAWKQATAPTFATRFVITHHCCKAISADAVTLRLEPYDDIIVVRHFS
jgi:hypothetical protein